MRKFAFMTIRCIVIAGLVIAGVFGSTGLASDFAWLNPMPQGNTLYSVYGFSENLQYAGGMRNLLEYRDGVYSSISLPISDPCIKDFFGLLPTDLYAVGDYDLSLGYGFKGMILHFNGTDWAVDYSGINASLNAVFGASGQPVFAVGSEGVILSKIGDVWTQLESGTTRDLHAGIIFPCGAGFIAGDNTVLQRSVEGDWTAEALPVQTGFRGIWGTASDNIYVCGEFGVLLHYNGDEWIQIENAVPRHLQDIRGIDETEIYAVGEKGVVHHISGQSIQNTWYLGDQKKNMHSVSVLGPGYLKVVGDAGDIWIYSDGEFASDVEGVRRNINGVWGSSPTNVFMVGDKGAILHWNGVTLEQMPSGTTQNLTRVMGTSPVSVFAVGDAGTVLRYDGSAWLALDSPTIHRLVGVWAASNTDVFVQAFNRETWRYDGESWHQIRGSLTSSYYGIWGFSPDDIYTFGGYEGSVIKPYLSHYDGENWQQITLPDGMVGLVKDVWGPDPDHLYAIVHHWDEHYLGLAIRTEGEWRSIDLPMNAYMYPTKITGTSPENIFILGEYGGTRMLWHFDGDTFQRIDNWIGNDTKDGWMFDATCMFFVGPGGLVITSGDVDLKTGVRLELPAVHFQPEDNFYLNGYLNNSGPHTFDDILVFFMLEVAGELYFWPGWERFDFGIMNIDYAMEDLGIGTKKIGVIQEFAWPETGSETIGGIRFYGAMISPETGALLGDLDMIEWSFGP